MNDWYIDRSKNFYNISFDPFISFLSSYNGDRDSNSLILALIASNVFDEDAGNLYAALTRFRDHGILNNSNQLGDSAVDYVNGMISKEELTVDLFLKRPARKKGSPNVKPLVILCKVFELMNELVADEDEVYLTYEECYKYLYCCDDLSDISVEYVDSIISNRPCTNVKLSRNEIINISIWANALRNTPLLISTKNKSIMKPNLFAKGFIDYIARCGQLMSETPTENNDVLYQYYCDRKTGITELIPCVFNDNVVFKNEKDVEKAFNYLFGIMSPTDLDLGYYFSHDCFGIYNSFLFFPGLVVRSIWIKNKAIGASLNGFLNRDK